MQTQRIFRNLIAAAGAVTITAGATATAGVLIDDDFADGSTAATGSTDSDWYNNWDNRADTNLSVSSQKLLWARDDNRSQDQRHSLWTYFTQQTLSDGDAIRAQLDLELEVRPDVDENIRFAFLNSNGSQRTSDAGGGNPPQRHDDIGVGVALATQSSPSASPQSSYIQELGTRLSEQPISRDLPDSTLDRLGSTNGFTLDSSGSEQLELVLTRSGNDLVIEFFSNGNLINGGRTISSATNFTFDQLAFAQSDVNGQAGSDLKLDNVVVEFVPIPEPGSAFLITAGIGVLAARRRFRLG